MASRLTEKEKQLLDANISTRVGLKPYEDGLWGSQGSKDFVHFQLFDENNNLIEFKSVPSSQFVVNTNNDNIEFYPGRHIRELGYQSGVFNVRYNFLRKLAGDEMPVLLHTVQKNSTKVGDVYTNINAIYVTEDSIVYAATEQDYKDNPTTTEQLAVEEMTYQIETISPSRTELRLKAKKINGSYQDDFIDIQTAVTLRDVQNNIGFIGGQVYDTKDLILTTEAGGFLFTQKMLQGTITIPDVFQVSQIDIPVKTNINIIKNGGGDELVTDSLGNILNTANMREWDQTLHDDSVRALNWSDGFLYHSSGTFGGTAHLGYHTHWVQDEGKDGGNCIKFPDQNEIFMDLPEWPNEQRYRMLAISQEVTNLVGQGVKHNDIANINMDIRSTVVGKGVQVSLRYTDQMIEEEEPVLPPEGYFDPQSPPPGEPAPENNPPNFVPNTSGNAAQVENCPPPRQNQILSTYDISFYDGAVGDTTDDGDMINGAGAWIIVSRQGTDRYTWGPNLVGAEYTQEGALSELEEWRWDGSAWTVNPNFSSPYPTAPINTVNTLEFPNAINVHPYQLEGQGTAKFKRDTNPGENRNWQTGTTLDGEDTKLTTICGVDASLVNNNAIILLKDDLVWIIGDVKYTTNKEKIHVLSIDEMFPQLHSTPIDNREDGVHSVYNDIFKHGRIQSITRTRQGSSNNHNRDNFFVVWYTDGTDNDDRNKAFIAEIGSETTLDIINVKDLDENFNNIVNQNGGELEWSFSRRSGNWDHYVCVKGTGKLWTMLDGDGNFFELVAGGEFFIDGSGTSNSFKNRFGDGTEIVDGNYFDVWFPAGHTSGHFSNYAGIYNVHIATGGNYINLKTDESGVSERLNINDVAFGAGEVGTGGEEIIYGSRNPGASNYNPIALYDDGSSEFTFDTNPTKSGTKSPIGLWTWNGSEWLDTAINPPRYTYKSPMNTRAIVAPEIAGEWVNISVEIPIPSDWLLNQKWYFYIYGQGKSLDGTMSQGIVWVDNVYIDFTLRDQSVTVPVYKSYSAQILSVNNDGSIISVNKSIREAALEIGANDDDEDGNPDIYNQPEVGGFDNFKVTYTNLNPKDLRTYLKFENDLFLTTNFKSDRLSVTSFPYSVVYKLYEPLPDAFEKFDECIIVKEMANPLEEKIKIIDFVNEEEPKLVLRSPDLNNVESPVQRRETQFKTESEILTSDAKVSTALRNEFLSQSIDSVEINTDYSKYENFVNFGSSEVRVRNFKRKLEDIELYKINSASYTGVSGSSGDMGVYHHKILDTENKFDRFENYMYFKSSSYITSSIGEFHDNAWPKASGEGTLNSPYVLAHTTSSQADTWFRNTINSASLYDDENSSKLSTLLPEHIKIDTNNQTYLRFTDMIGQHFDGIWEYINAITDITDRRDRLDEGISKDLLYSVGKSLGWNLSDGKDLISLSRYALGKEVTGSSSSNYSVTPERDISREIWSRIINNMPFFLKNKGTVRALKGLINVYGIPSTILRVKEFGGPDLDDNASPQFEITRKFTKALDFKGAQSVRVAWADDIESQRKPDTVEFRFRAATGSNQILVEKQDSNNQHWFVRLKDNGSTDNYGQVSFMLSGSAVGKDLGEFKEITSTSLPIYDGDFYSVMAGRLSGSSNTAVSQSYQLNVGKYDSSRSKINLYSTATMDVTQAASSSFSNAWTGSGDIHIGGSGDINGVGVQFSGSIMEYRHWTEVLNTGSFKNHVSNPKAYDGNTLSSSYNNLVLRYSFNDNKDLSADVEGIRDVSSNQTQTLSGSHSGFTGNFFRSVEDELKTHIPSIGALRRTTNKIRIEDNKLKPGFNLNLKHRATDSAYDTAPNDSNKVGIWFAPTDVINTDIINSVGNLNFDNFLGDPRDKEENSYRGLENAADDYWKKYTAPNNFWDYIRLIKYYDQSLFPQIRKLIPARAKPDIGLLIEPNIFERPKVVIGKKPTAEDRFFSSSINIPDEVITITGSYNAGFSITDYDAYTGRLDIFSYDSGSSVISASGEYTTFEATGSEINERAYELSIWQRLGEGNYKSSSITSGDTKFNEVFQPIVTGSRIYGVNQKLIPLYSSSLSASLQIAYSSSFFNVDLDNFNHLTQGLINSYYVGVKNTRKTTSDNKPPVEVIISAPTKLVTTKGGDSTLTTGDGIVSEFKEVVSKEEKAILKQEEDLGKPKVKKVRGLRKLKSKPESDQMRKKKLKEDTFNKKLNLGGVMKESTKGKEEDDKKDK